SAEVQDALDLDLRAARQLRDADRRACRVGFGAVERHDLVHLGEVRQIGEVDVHLDGLRERDAGGLRHRLEILEHAADLRLDVTAHQLHGGRVERYLPGQVHGVAGAYRLRIGADRLRRV